MRTWISALVGAVFSILMFTAQPTMAQQFCIPTNKLLITMKDRFNEYPRSGGLINGGQGVFIVFAAEDNSTWSIIISEGKRACLLSSGGNWLSFRMRKIGPTPPHL